MLERVGFASMDLPQVRKMTQAGGKMYEGLVRRFNDLMVARGGELYVMYGQAEASPRISCVPPERFAEKIGSAGIALPGGTLAIRTPEGITTAPNVEGEVIYSGRNVMMGYAEKRSDGSASPRMPLTSPFLTGRPSPRSMPSTTTSSMMMHES